MAAPWDSSSSSWAGLTFSGSSANSTIDGDVLAVSSAAVGEEDAFWQFTLVTDTVDDERTAFGVVTKPVTAQHYDAECCRSTSCKIRLVALHRCAQHGHYV